VTTASERQHVNASGNPKRSWPTWIEANRYAQALAVLKPHVKLVEAYQCKVCDLFHVGTVPRGVALERVELGQRALGALLQENQRKRSGRRYAVHRRARAAVSVAERRAA
jgi:hypothetical protein